MLKFLRQWYRSWADHDGRGVDEVFAGREVLDDHEFYLRYFPDRSVSEPVVVGVRQEFITHLPLDMRRLAPDDSFGRELRFVWSYDSLADVELVCAIERRFGISISEAEGREALTMGDIIRLVDRKFEAKPA